MVAVEPSLTGELVSMESLAGERLHNQALPQEFYDGRHSRTIRLVGEEAVEKLWKSKVFVAGLGGVGSYVVETLARAGVGNFVLLDKDRVVESNINRQLVASYRTLGQLKAEVAAERIRAVSPQAQVTCLPLFYGKETARQVDFSGCDFIADAIDNVTGKLLLAEAAFEKKIPIIASMGTGNKLDPSRFQIADISKTSVCPLARVMRRELRARGIRSGYTVVFSTEPPHAVLPSQTPASISFVPAAAGLLMASHIIRQLMD